ncbi:MAG: hypothetical protein V4736_13450 [Bdellovibrionota bacterium]
MQRFLMASMFTVSAYLLWQNDSPVNTSYANQEGLNKSNIVYTAGPGGRPVEHRLNPVNEESQSTASAIVHSPGHPHIQNREALVEGSKLRQPASFNE